MQRLENEVLSLLANLELVRPQIGASAGIAEHHLESPLDSLEKGSSSLQRTTVASCVEHAKLRRLTLTGKVIRKTTRHDCSSLLKRSVASEKQSHCLAAGEFHFPESFKCHVIDATLFKLDFANVSVD